jgi:hypothetical protein
MVGTSFSFTLWHKTKNRFMKPKEIANLFSDYIEQGTTPKGVKIVSFFSHLTSSQKLLLAKNISKAFTSYVAEEKVRSESRNKKKKEISELKKRAKELGLVISEV